MISVYHNIEYDVRLQVASGNGKNETNKKRGRCWCNYLGHYFQYLIM